MSDERALLRAITEFPEDDTVRLVYADWLQENGQPERAEFIRIECEMATLEIDEETAPDEWKCPRYWELHSRAAELYDRHASKWFGALLKTHRGEMETRRGFPYHVALTARKFIDRAAELFKAAPTIENVFIGRLGRNMPELARTPALGHVRQLTFFETPFWLAEAQQLAASPYLGNLRELEIGFTDTQIGREGAVAFARAKSIRQLQRLDINNHAIGDHGAEAIVYSDRLATLTNIHFGNNGLTDTTTSALSWADNLKLTSLNLMDNHLSGEGLLALSAENLTGLEHLSVMSNPIGQAGAINLARMPAAACLRELGVSDCDMDDAALAVLLEAKWPQLSELSLTMNHIGPRAVKALAANRSLTKLEILHAARCEITSTTARELGRVSLPGLRTLWLGANPLGARGVRALLSGPLVQSLDALHLDDTQLDDDGAVALARSRAVANLRSLWLGENGITNRGALALAESPHLEKVQSLYMPENRVGKKGREALVKRFGDRVDLGTDE